MGMGRHGRQGGQGVRIRDEDMRSTMLYLYKGQLIHRHVYDLG